MAVYELAAAVKQRILDLDAAAQRSATLGAPAPGPGAAAGEQRPLGSQP
jgi:hypothetical protein